MKSAQIRSRTKLLLLCSVLLLSTMCRLLHHINSIWIVNKIRKEMLEMWPFSSVAQSRRSCLWSFAISHNSFFIFSPALIFVIEQHKLCHLRWINFAARSPPTRASTLAISLFHLISIKVPFFFFFVFVFFSFFCFSWSATFCFVSFAQRRGTRKMNGKK